MNCYGQYEKKCITIPWFLSPFETQLYIKLQLLVPITGVTADIVSDLSSLNSFLRTNTAIKAKGLNYIAEGFNCDSVLNIPLMIS